jgi:hypothetical protein
MINVSHNEVQLMFPEGWEDQSHIIVMGPAQADFRSNIVLIAEGLKDGETLEKVTARALEGLQVFPEFSLTSQAASKLGPHQGILREHTFTHDEKKLTQLQFATIYGKRVFTLTFTDLSSRIAKSRQGALDIFQKLQLRAASDGFEAKQKLMELSPQSDAPQAAPSGKSIPVPRQKVKG